MSGVSQLAAITAGGAIGVYCIAVGVNHNTGPLVAELRGEAGYVFFLGSLFAIGALHKFGPTGKITDAMLAISVLAVLLQVGAKIDLQQFVAGAFAKMQSLGNPPTV